MTSHSDPREEQLSIPHIADPQLVELLRDSPVLASEGTDRFGLCSILVDGGLMRENHCPEAMGATQFSVTLAGENYMQREGIITC